MKKYNEYIKESNTKQSIIDRITEESKISNEMKEFFDECFIDVLEKFNSKSEIKAKRVFSKDYDYSYFRDFYIIEIAFEKYLLTIDNISTYLLNLNEYFLNIKNSCDKIRTKYNNLLIITKGSNNESLSIKNLDKISIKICKNYF